MEFEDWYTIKLENLLLSTFIQRTVEVVTSRWTKEWLFVLVRHYLDAVEGRRFQIAYETVYLTSMFKGSNCIANAKSQFSKRNQHGVREEKRESKLPDMNRVSCAEVLSHKSQA
jgi:hypothetical protein